MKKIFETQGTCSKSIVLDIDEQTDTIRSVEFIGGCAGNTQGIARLVRGMKPTDVITRLQGVQCGTKGTSCPDQLARALCQVMGQQ